MELPLLGHLDNSPSRPLRAGTKLALPLWLAEMLALANAAPADDPDGAARSFAGLNLPPALSDEAVQALKADPRAVALRDRSPHFYALAARMLDLFEERELGAVLRSTFVLRAGEIALHARKAGGGARDREDGGGSNLGVGGAGEEFLRGLDEWERGLFRKAHEGTRAGKEYLDTVKRH